MADGASDYSSPHLNISRFVSSKAYGSPKQNQTRYPARDRAAHAASLIAQLDHAQQMASSRSVELVPGFEAIEAGSRLEVESAPETDLPNLERTRSDIRVGAVRELPNGAEVATLILPNAALATIRTNIESYRDTNTEGGNPVQRAFVEPIQEIREAWIDSLWTDPRPLPADDSPIWWECWCFPDRTEVLQRAASRLQHVRVSERRLFFPEMTVVPLYATRTQIERIISSVSAIAELRSATDTPSFFMRSPVKDQIEWVNSLERRIVGPKDNAPSVCILDSGVNRGHSLLEPWLPEDAMFAVDEDWGTADDRDHGTLLAGLALYGDLTEPLADEREVGLSHSLESVKVIQPPDMEGSDPNSFGAITQAGIALPEIAFPKKRRTYSLTVTNKDVSGERPSSWSAALDQSAAGVAIGDEGGKDSRRLIVVAAGNIQDDAKVADLADPDEFPIEDPAQSWNSLTIGGYTDKVDIHEEGYEEWSAYANVGERSPYSRASTDWPNSHTAIKPEVVFDAGNRALSPNESDLVSGLDSLSLLSTGSKLERPIDTIWATSAATAQAARMCAIIQSSYESFWPETVRALVVHSANWSPAMEQSLENVSKNERRNLLRQFGYGIPDLSRALSSAQSDLALVAQNKIKPFTRVKSKGVGFSQAHFYELPWPKQILESLGSAEVKMKVTLSYFIEPSPGQIAPVSANKYRSAGLRIGVKRAGESIGNFYKRINRLEREKGEKAPSGDGDPNWLFGLESVSAGSLHCDIWTGPAVDLADRGHVVVYPVSGWWRDRPKLKGYEKELCYALIITLTSPEADVDLYSEISSIVEAALDVPISV